MSIRGMMGILCVYVVSISVTQCSVTGPDQGLQGGRKVPNAKGGRTGEVGNLRGVGTVLMPRMREGW